MFFCYQKRCKIISFFSIDQIVRMIFSFICLISYVFNRNRIVFNSNLTIDAVEPANLLLPRYKYISSRICLYSVVFFWGSGIWCEIMKRGDWDESSVGNRWNIYIYNNSRKIFSCCCALSRARTGTARTIGVWDQRVYQFRHQGSGPSSNKANINLLTVQSYELFVISATLCGNFFLLKFSESFTGVWIFFCFFAYWSTVGLYSEIFEEWGGAACHVHS